MNLAAFNSLESYSKYRERRKVKNQSCDWIVTKSEKPPNDVNEQIATDQPIAAPRSTIHFGRGEGRNLAKRSIANKVAIESD
jgi:hypothetical protein